MTSEFTALLLIEHIQAVKEAIKHLTADVQASEDQLRGILGHDYDGSKTYPVGQYKVTVTTGFNLKIDDSFYKQYLADGYLIDEKFDVVQEVVEYKINKKALNAVSEYGSLQDQILLSKFITATEKKPYVSIKLAGDK